MRLFAFVIAICIVISIVAGYSAEIRALTYPIVDTGQDGFYSNSRKIGEPKPGKSFHGQDAQFTRNAPSYADNGDGTVTDNVTGLMWQKSFAVMTYDQAVRKASSFELAGHSDWRLPSLKEVYSLALFSGVDASSRNMNGIPSGARPFIHDVFDFRYGANGRRPIDTQMLSSTVYEGRTMGRQRTVFGFNLADGRIKGYPMNDPRSRSGKQFTVRFVRGNPDYGNNHFADNEDGSVSDLATGLMWSRADSAKGLDWEDALKWVAEKNEQNYLGHNDWRLPNAKELQSLVDYTRSPQETRSAAIDPLFDVTTIRNEGGKTDYPSYWSSTTFLSTRGASEAVYVCFGECLGFFSPPGRSRQATLMDVHGAGAQRSDPKSGSVGRYRNGRGPQGDVVRIRHFARLVRDF
jgi:hypothetical protein